MKFVYKIPKKNIASNQDTCAVAPEAMLAPIKSNSDFLPCETHNDLDIENHTTQPGQTHHGSESGYNVIKPYCSSGGDRPHYRSRYNSHSSHSWEKDYYSCRRGAYPRGLPFNKRPDAHPASSTDHIHHQKETKKEIVPSPLEGVSYYDIKRVIEHAEQLKKKQMSNSFVDARAAAEVHPGHSASSSALKTGVRIALLQALLFSPVTPYSLSLVRDTRISNT